MLGPTLKKARKVVERHDLNGVRKHEVPVERWRIKRVRLMKELPSVPRDEFEAENFTDAKAEAMRLCASIMADAGLIESIELEKVEESDRKP
jgi:hypothetical protein